VVRVETEAAVVVVVLPVLVLAAARAATASQSYASISEDIHMKFAIIQEGQVANIILAESAWVATNAFGAVSIDGLDPQPGPGWLFDGQNFAPPPMPAVQQPPRWNDTNLDQRYHWIDVGPFFDRFGAKALSITGSTDPQVQGLVTLLLPRKYVDLKRADLPAMLDMLVSKGLITSADKSAVLNPQTAEYERHVKGMVQPT
jgi:hypothetical protein